MNCKKRKEDLLKLNWGDAFRWFLFSLILGSLLPVWAAYIALRLFNSFSGWVHFFVNGEFAIYSAALFASILTTEIVNPRSIINKFIAYCGILIAALLFAGVVIANTKELDINISLVINSSLILFFLSVALSFFVELNKNIYGVNIEKFRTDELTNLENGLDKHIGGRLDA